jgi:hypothetical protein
VGAPASRRARSRAVRVALALSGATLTATRDGAADEPPPAVPGDEMLAPTTLPALRHAGAAFEFEYLGAGVGQAPLAGFSSLGSTFAWMSRFEAEVAVAPRRWFVGGAWDFASAAAPGVGRALLHGNPEVWLRGAWAHPTGLVAGGGLGWMIPLPRSDAPEVQAAQETVRAVRAWDAATFSTNELTLRPAFDVRWASGPVAVQFRSGLDIALDLEDASTNLVARAGLFGGLQATRWMCLGAEISEVYPITADIPDAERAAITLSPSVRFRVGALEPGLSLLVPLSTPLEGVADGFFAVRLHVRLALEPRPRREPDPVDVAPPGELDLPPVDALVP